MLTVARHLLSILILPFTVTVVVPIWLAQSRGIVPRGPVGATEIALFMLGALLLVAGLLLFVASVARFAREGRGTLAPWDPPREFVVTGPYRYVRNPMISGVVFILFAESALLRSQSHFLWALLFLAGNIVHIPLVEERALQKRFGAPYDEYRRHVGRFIPRLTPWVPSDR